MMWLPRDARIILTAKFIRTFGFGLMGVVLGLYLEEAGYQPQQVGLILTASLAGSAVLTGMMAVRADRIGRRRTLILSTGLMVISGLAFSVAQSSLLLIAAALTGTISATSGEVGPFEPIEMAVLPQIVPTERRNALFGWYNTVSAIAVALGALAAGVPAVLQTSRGIDVLVSYRVLFTIYAGLALGSMGVLALLSHEVEATPTPQSITRRAMPLHESRGVVARLAGLFALDALGGGFVVQSLIAYWFSLKFGVGGEVLGPVFFGVNVMKAASYQGAVWLANRIGLINTMVFTHLPSNVLLMLIPVMPTLPLAILVLLLRHALAQMDVPARGSYVVAVVHPDERTAATGVTTLARTAAQAVSPAIAGVALQLASLGAPFFIAGALKIVYDLGLYMSFRRLKPADELAREKV
jgi:MFS family permease